MPLPAGTRLEHYDIVEPLGAGGMGEVYRALDTKLRREVALKILPPKFAADPSRLTRFEREAHLLASLNHPNIAAIYGLENADGIRFLVLELVEGPTLADRLRSGPLETGEALRIAAGIAEALEAAHEKGVVHRDLKPGNVKITPQGKVKVLDFGLAKAMGDPEPTHTSGTASESTVTLEETRAGVVMGTAAYIESRTGGGEAHRQAFRCVELRRRAIRDAQRQALFRRQNHVSRPGAHPGAGAGLAGSAAECSRRSAPVAGTMPGKRPGQASAGYRRRRKNG